RTKKRTGSVLSARIPITATDQIPEANEVTMTADHAKAIADYFAIMFDQEIKYTVKVLRAVPNDRRDYKPDEKSRTAWELVTHLVSSDLWFLDSVCDGVFVYD